MKLSNTQPDGNDEATRLLRLAIALLEEVVDRPRLDAIGLTSAHHPDVERKRDLDPAQAVPAQKLTSKTRRTTYMPDSLWKRLTVLETVMKVEYDLKANMSDLMNIAVERLVMDHEVNGEESWGVRRLRARPGK